MAIIFDGNQFAREIEEKVRSRVAGMERKPKLVTIYDPNDVGSRIYTQIKFRKSQDLGILFEKFEILDPQFKTDPKQFIENLNNDNSIDGIMVQTPVERQEELINMINKEKDVDGLREDSPYTSATVRAVMEILNQALKYLNIGQIQNNKLDQRVVIVGSSGEVGRRLEKVISGHCNYWGMGREDFDTERIKTADVIISCTGQEGLIKADMVKEDAICIDVGYPKGDFDPAAAKRVKFFTPVPGGVGPVTVAMLFTNLIKI